MRNFSGLIALGTMLAQSHPAIAYTEPQTVDGWAISETKLGCEMKPAVWALYDPSFWVNQSGKEGWSHESNGAIGDQEWTEFAEKFPRKMKQNYVIDGRSIDMKALRAGPGLGAFTGAKKAALVSEGYVDIRTRDQRIAAGIGAPRNMNNFEWKIIEQAVPAPSVKAAAALRACAAAPRAASQPATIVRGYPAQYAPYGIKEGTFSEQVICQRAFGGRIPPFDFTLSVDAEGNVTNVTQPGGTLSEQAAIIAPILKRALRYRPATDGSGKFTDSTVAYRSPAINSRCEDQ